MRGADSWSTLAGLPIARLRHAGRIAGLRRRTLVARLTSGPHDVLAFRFPRPGSSLPGTCHHHSPCHFPRRTRQPRTHKD